MYVQTVQRCLGNQNTRANYRDGRRVCHIKPFTSTLDELSGNLHIQKAFV